MRFKDATKIIDGSVLQFREDRPIATLLIDSRKAVISDSSLFFAIHGDRHDGHDYLTELYRFGLRQFVVEKDCELSDLPLANVVRVASAVVALQQIVAHHRSQFRIPVVGITGSNGKTIVKEWLYQVLSPEMEIVRNPGSYNSQVGVPLSVWEMDERHQLGIFEAGISKVGEMERLRTVIQPTIGLFTNLGTAHDQGFSSREEKASEKVKLFKGCDFVLYCKEHSLVAAALQETKQATISWGFTSGADISLSESGPNIRAIFRGNTIEFALPFSDPGLRENALHVAALMMARGYTEAVIRERISALRSIPMRLELKQGVNGSILIDDSYNNDLAGLRISLDFLKIQQKEKKTVILTDVMQSGLSIKEWISQIKTLLSSVHSLRFIGIGPILNAHHSAFASGEFYDSTRDFLDQCDPSSFADQVVLIKGARDFRVEEIVRRLQRKLHGTVMEVDMTALINNLNFFKSQLNPGTRIMAMVKAFAYGSGSEEVANLLQYHRVDYLGVAYADEGVDLRKNNISLPIMVMSPAEEGFNSLVEFRLEPSIYNLSLLHAWISFLEGRPSTLHIKLDTGMRRLGFDREDLSEVENLLRANPNLRVVSFFTHLSGADDPAHDDFSHEQVNRFEDACSQLDKVLGYRPLRHVLNSSGILRLSKYQFDMVRLGIGLYGIDPTGDGRASLTPVVTLKTVISQIKTIKKDETVGYGRKGKAAKEMRIATLAIGYADGFSRSFSNGKGVVLIHGKKASVIGNVCMDMTMVDLGDIPAQAGDEVIVFGPGLPVEEVARRIDTIPYEILTNTSERVKRVFFAEGL